MELKALLKQCDEHVRVELGSMPEVKDVVAFDPAVDVPHIDARRWFRVQDVVAVVADLVSSTKLGTGKRAQSTASIYEAALRPVVDIFAEFSAQHIEIQGDCVIGLFWDDTAVERAMCAGITVKTFSKNHLVKRLEAKWQGEDKLPSTGFKVGLATSTLLVKRIGRAKSTHQAMVWPGKALNYAVKAAQSAARHELVVTGGVWDLIESNDYLTYSCDCQDATPGLWRDHDIAKLDHDDAERCGRLLESAWCDICGEGFCNAILAGDTERPVAGRYRVLRSQSLFASAVAKKAQQDRRRRRDLNHLRSVS